MEALTFKEIMEQSIVMPILLVYLVMNRWVVRGFALSGTKG